jgi:ADP-ribosylglycohydrolase
VTRIVVFAFYSREFQIIFGIGAALRVVACACMMMFDRNKQK